MPNNITQEHRAWLNDRVVTRYGFDKTAAHSDNHITAEIHEILREDGTHSTAIAPREGAFYTKDVVLKDISNPTVPRLLVKGTRDANGNMPQAGTYDYVCTEPSTVVGSITGKEACYVIVFPGNNPPDKVDLSYQVVGGQYVHDATILVKIYENLSEQWVEWDSILNKQERFNGNYHGHNINDVYGWEYMVEAIDRLSRVMELGHIPSYVAMMNKFCDIVSRAIRPRVRLNHEDHFNGLPSEGYLTKNDLIHILYKPEADLPKLYNKTFESRYEEATGFYRHAVMSPTPAGSFWTLNQMFSVEYIILNKNDNTKRIRIITATLGLIAMPASNGPNKMGFRHLVLDPNVPEEVVVSIAIYHSTLQGVNLSIHHDLNEDETHNYKELPKLSRNSTSYP